LDDDSTSDVTLSVDSSSSGSAIDEKTAKNSYNREPLKPKLSNNKPIALPSKTLNNGLSRKKNNLDSLELKTENLIEKR
jgi:hypothetical protein